MQSCQKNAELVPHPQVIEFTDADDGSSFEVRSRNVKILSRSGIHTTASSKVNSRNCDSFRSMHKVYLGHPLALHCSGKYVAYGIKVRQHRAGMVRLVNTHTEETAVILGMQGKIQDLAFAEKETQVILACVDELGNLFLYEVDVAADKLVYTLLLFVMQDHNSTPSTNHRLVFCPFMAEDNRLVVTHDEKAEVWNVSMVTQRYGCGPLLAETVKEGYLQISEHSKPIVDAVFSPDGSALATASLDGEVKFFQVYMQYESKPRCLREWKPHDGKPLSALFFLNNHRGFNPEAQFGKFAVTGALNNSELKLWSCESWTCVQTIRFEPEISKIECSLKAGLDVGTGCLVLSDIYKRVLYVLKIQQKSEETTALVSSVTEFPLQFPVRNFAIVDAKLGKKPITSISFGAEDADKAEQQYVPTVVKMYFLQPKCLQECSLILQPSSSLPVTSKSLLSASHDTLGCDASRAGFGGTPIKFIAPVGIDYEYGKKGEKIQINVQRHCISLMPEYKDKSLEELRMEDYVAKGKVPQIDVYSGATSATCFTSSVELCAQRLGHGFSTTKRGTRSGEGTPSSPSRPRGISHQSSARSPRPASIAVTGETDPSKMGTARQAHGPDMAPTVGSYIDDRTTVPRVCSALKSSQPKIDSTRKTGERAVKPPKPSSKQSPKATSLVSTGNEGALRIPEVESEPQPVESEVAENTVEEPRDAATQDEVCQPESALEQNKGLAETTDKLERKSEMTDPDLTSIACTLGVSPARQELMQRALLVLFQTVRDPRAEYYERRLMSCGVNPSVARTRGRKFHQNLVKYDRALPTDKFSIVHSIHIEKPKNEEEELDDDEDDVWYTAEEGKEDEDNEVGDHCFPMDGGHEQSSLDNPIQGIVGILIEETGVFACLAVAFAIFMAFILSNWCF